MNVLTISLGKVAGGGVMSSLERVRGVESGATEVDRGAEEFKSSIVP